MENYFVYDDPKQQLFKEEVARGTRLLNIRGLSQSGESGDCSVRDLETGLIYVSGSPDWCFQKNLLDARGWERWVTTIDGDDLIPWSTPTVEWPMHVAIYEARDDIGAVCHTHGVWASVFAALRMDVPLEKADEGLTGVIPCTDYRPAGSPDVGTVVAEAMKDGYDWALMGNHGAVTVGKTLDEAFDKAMYMEHLCERVYFALLAEKHLDSLFA
ncbi:MAG TPA: class II aldolase/adducin family protein [Candidatus Coprovicinus avistercoris]|uniref:Class II aldolase/adducin family protein n=1 Tax=Candidatus Coprovicinus avistercoris TaxID=2840754 RepID=A0A9D1HY51_9ACTN|nr:class II aldolase/adducin family protein [Candidatus Coprovicinus avistercoris]